MEFRSPHITKNGFIISDHEADGKLVLRILLLPDAGLPVDRVSMHWKRVLFVHGEFTPDAVFGADSLTLPQVLLLDQHCHAEIDSYESPHISLSACLELEPRSSIPSSLSL